MRALALRFPFAFLLVVALAAACHAPASSDSTPNDGGAAADAPRDGAADARIVQVDRKAFPRVLNPAGPEATLFYAGWGEGCQRAKSPRPEQVPDLTGAESVACPDALRNPAWNRCAGGALFASSDGKKCLCVTGGPSAQALDVPCPDLAKP